MKWSDLKFWKSDTWDKLVTYIQESDKYACGWDDYEKAFDLTPFEDVKVVILGQDPYHKKGQAHGLAFSVPEGCRIPPSLRTILDEYVDDLGYRKPSSGDLTHWAVRGVLLLNTILTVEEGKPLSHKGLGWERLAYEAIRTLSVERQGLVFMLWGKKAQEYEGAIDADRHLILKAGHPSPLASLGKRKKDSFKGCRHFSKANAYLGDRAVDWRLP